MINIDSFEFADNMIMKIDHGDPTIFHFVEPFFVIAIIRIVKIENIFADQNEFVNTFFHHWFDDVPLEDHDIVSDGIIPFSHHFDNSITLFIFCEKDLDKKSGRADRIPLRMNVVIVNRITEFKLTVFAVIERRKRIFRSHIIHSPTVKRFYIMHAQK